MTIKYLDSKRVSGTSTGSSTGTAYNIDGLTATSQNVAISPVVNPLGVAFKPDGTEMFICDKDTTVGGVSQWTLSTAWDVSTATMTGSVFSPSSQFSNRSTSGISFKPDGTIMYLTSIDSSLDKVWQYTLSTAWDLSTASYASKSLDFSSQTGNGYSGQISADGTKVYVTPVQGYPTASDPLRLIIYQYNLSTAWDLSTGSYSQTFAPSGSTYTTGLIFTPDGTKFTTAGSSILQYSMSTAWDISTASIDSVSVARTQHGITYYKSPVAWGNGGEYIFSMEATSSGTRYIHKYGFGTQSDKTDLTNIQDNSIYIETDTAKRFWFNGSSWITSLRGIFAGGVDSGGSKVNTMDYITIDTTGNATDFGDLTSNIKVPTGLSSPTRGVWGGGQTSGYVDTMDYVTIATTGNATDFGNLTSARGYVCGASNETRGIFYSGYNSGVQDRIDYITIATVGNATDFGNAGTARESPAGVSSDTRAVFGGGYVGSAQPIIDYITIATLGNGTSFGSLTTSRYAASGVDNGTRGCFAGGWISNGQNTIDYITIATTGNATDFGDLTVGRAYSGSVSSDTRGVWGGGNASSKENTIDYITIATLGNATDFGDLTTSRGHMSQGVSEA